MKTVNRRDGGLFRRSLTKKLLVTSLAFGVASTSGVTYAQAEADGDLETIVVTGIRGALRSALAQKQDSNNLIEVIVADDIGKLPDQNLAEVLENVTGIQITRTAGVGTGVQIRGTNSNRTEINGVATSGSGAGRTGINFEDVSAGIISEVQVTKAAEAKTVEGSVGGTINLKTIRPLELTERVATARVQIEESSLSNESATPRLSGTYGNNWSTDSGEFGFVVAASYAETAVTSLRPRVDRDNFNASDAGEPASRDFDYLPIQFLNAEIENFDYETSNIASTFEWSPNDDVRVYFDAIINDQERRQGSSRVQASGISGGDIRNIYAPSSFETVNFGTIETPNGPVAIGSIQAALTGNLPVAEDGIDGNLRFSGDTNSRITESRIFSLGTEWQITDRLNSTFEYAMSKNDSTTPRINTTLNFINPNAATNASNENGSPFVYDLRNGSLTYGIDHAADRAPSVADLTNPANIVLRDVQQSQSFTENSEDALRADFVFDLDAGPVTTVDFGARFSKTNSLQDVRNLNLGLRAMSDSPTGDLFQNILIPGPDNYKHDGRELYYSDYLIINPDAVHNDYDGVINYLNDAITAHGGSRPIGNPTSSTSSFFSIDEDTNALYAQANFEHGIFRGNFGVRYIETDVTSNGFSTLDGVTSPISDKGSYDFVLPRINLVANVTDDVVLRLGYGEDINRPGFNRLSSAFTFSTSPNPAVAKGNPALSPEEVKSFDLSAEWYFAPGAIASIGYFSKKRNGIFFQSDSNPFEDPVTGFRDITGPVCEQGGIFNPIADINVFSDVTGVGVCVPLSTTINGAGTTKQDGIELAFQYDLAEFEDSLGWASGFGFLLNYTKQDFSGGDESFAPTSRANTVFSSLGHADLRLAQPLIDNSENSYNITVFYEKYGISARARYTWREAFRTLDFVGTSSRPWGYPAVTEDRGQLNASLSYDVNDRLNIGLEVVNLTEEDVVQSCVNEGALLCYQGLTDRRITLGASYRF